MKIGALLYPERVEGRPKTRADCDSVPRPCPYVGCPHHLYADVSEIGSLVVRFPDLEPWELAWSCSLDIADAAELAGGMTLEAVGRMMNMTRERIRQIETAAMATFLDDTALTEAEMVSGRPGDAGLDALGPDGAEGHGHHGEHEDPQDPGEKPSE